MIKFNAIHFPVIKLSMTNETDLRDHTVICKQPTSHQITNFPKEMSNNFLIRIPLQIILLGYPPNTMAVQRIPSFQVPAHWMKNHYFHRCPLSINQYQWPLQKRHLHHVQLIARKKKSLAAVGVSSFAPKRQPRRNSGVY